MLQSISNWFKKKFLNQHEAPLRVQVRGVHRGKSLVKGAISGLALSENA